MNTSAEEIPQADTAITASVLDELTAAASEKQAVDKQSLQQLLAPVQNRLRVGQVLAALSGLVAVAPYVALVRLGELLVSAYAAGVTPDAGAVWAVVGWLVGAFTLRLVLYFVALSLTHFADISLVRNIRGRMVDSLSRAPLSWFTATTSGRVRKAIQDDLHALHMLIAHAPVERASAVFMPLGLLGYAFFIDWRLGLLALATLPVYAGIYGWAMRDMPVKTAEMEARLAKVSSRMIEFVAGITVVKAFGTVGRAHGRYTEAAGEFGRFWQAWNGPLVKANAVGMGFVSVPILLAVNLTGGAWMVQAGWVSAPDILATTLIALVVPAAAQTIGNGAWAYQRAGASATRILQLIDTPTLPEPAHPEKPASDEVRFEDVSYSYGDTLAADHVTLTLPAGSVTALIGPSGSGKSTLATMVARFQDPDAGRVTLGGVDLRSIPSAVLYRTVAFVLQDPQLMRMSICDNIALARPDATDAQIREAAASARIADEIDALEHGYDSIVGQDTELSGGQKQRIAIARALLADAPVLILDEATAFTDPESEAEIQAALTRLARGRTVLVIAHRPASIVGADRIVVLDRGRVVAQGTHDELADEPHYRALWHGIRTHDEEEQA
ncbi:MAG: ABC transporter ATP-binding protein [Propioniciclava sp.]|uniref:ABC transporter ATP-binding protein n=1 Tax=Propioniciclava sp. TaxID=2038686 RepID=UPI0039E21903